MLRRCWGCGSLNANNVESNEHTVYCAALTDWLWERQNDLSTALLSVVVVDPHRRERLTSNAFALTVWSHANVQLTAAELINACWPCCPHHHIRLLCKHYGQCLFLMRQSWLIMCAYLKYNSLYCMPLAWVIASDNSCGVHTFTAFYSMFLHVFITFKTFIHLFICTGD